MINTIYDAIAARAPKGQATDADKVLAARDVIFWVQNGDEGASFAAECLADYGIGITHLDKAVREHRALCLHGGRFIRGLGGKHAEFVAAAAEISAAL
jgi:hypothetical protein